MHVTVLDCAAAMYSAAFELRDRTHPARLWSGLAGKGWQHNWKNPAMQVFAYCRAQEKADKAAERARVKAQKQADKAADKAAKAQATHERRHEKGWCH